MPTQPSTVPELLLSRAEGKPDTIIYRFPEREGLQRAITTAHLLCRARAVGARLQRMRLAGERVLLLFPTGPGFLEAFYGCLMAGAIAIPAPPPGLTQRAQGRLAAIAGDARPALIMGDEVQADAAAELPGIPWLRPSEVADDEGLDWRDPGVRPEDLGWLQYTSGSTSAPRGVMITHANILANLDTCARGWRYDADSRAVTWVPNYHDDGLVNGTLLPLYAGVPTTMISPAAFARDPLGWLRLISDTRATHSGGPNVAYELCIRRAAHQAPVGLDLSAWRVAYNAAEPVRADTLRRFHAAFAPAGLRLEALCPSFGLAEATLLVSTGPLDRPPASLRLSAEALERGRVRPAAPGERARELVGCGDVAPGVRVIIAHPEDLRPSAPDEVGEVWVGGPSVSQGYWERPQVNDGLFRARLEGVDGTWMRTGDLGFLHDNQLYICGRLKDLIIVAGSNHYPQDLEATAAAASGALRPGNAVAFGVDLDGAERVVLVGELREGWAGDLDAAAERVRDAIGEAHGLSLHALILISQGSMPKTSSGKLQRRLTSRLWQGGELPIARAWTWGGQPEEAPTPTTPPRAEPIAIIGMALRTAGARSPEDLWALGADDRDALTEIPEARMALWESWDAGVRTLPQLSVRRGGFMDEVEHFDADYFRISAREALSLDPQQRHLLELSVEALEDAGLPAEGLAGSRTAVIVGGIDNEYLRLTMRQAETMTAWTGTGGTMSLLANRLSYVHDLRGPSLCADTACSSALTALHLAVRCLREGEADLALVAGVNLMLTPGITLAFTAAGALSPRGRSQPFSAESDGYVRGEAAGVLVLRRLSDALAHGDRIHATILGSALGEDGRTDGIMAPNALSQACVLRDALRDAGVRPDEVAFVETHGTSTPRGDPAEARALGEVYGPGRPVDRPLWLSAVKSRVGHTEGAAGVVGVVSAVGALRDRRVAPITGLTSPNPAVPFGQLGLGLPTAPVALPAGRALAGVSSFGFGGANAHVILERGPDPAAPTPGPGPGLLLLSARDAVALARRAADTAAHLRNTNREDLSDLCWTAATRRCHHPWRLAVLGDDAETLAAALDRATPAQTGAPRPLLGLLSGHGGQHAAIAAALDHPLYAEPLAGIRATLARVLGRDPLASPDPDAVAWAQPAIFALQVATGLGLRRIGLAPAAWVGHSLGEVAAAVLAGALTAEEGARIVALRSRLMSRVEGRGALLSVALGAPALAARIAEHNLDVVVAVDLAPGRSAAAGTPEAIAALGALLRDQGVASRPVATRVAFHSPQMDELCAELAEGLADLAPRPASTPLFSTVTGGRVQGPELSAAHWVANLQGRARLREAMAAALAGRDGADVLEIGPAPTLAGPAREALAGRPGLVLSTARREGPPGPREALARLWEGGHDLDWARLFPRGGQLVDLPRYPWQRRRFWQDFGTARRGDRHALVRRPDTLRPGESRRWALDLSSQAWILDHRVRGRVLLPGAALLEAARAAATEALCLPEIELHGTEFRLPLVPPEQGPWTAWLNLTCEEQGASWTISEVPDGPPNALGRIRAAGPAAEPEPLDAIRARCTPMEIDDFYAHHRARGLDYGPAFQGVAGLRVGRGEILGELDAPGAVSATLSGFGAHPALLDAAFQVNGASPEVALRPYVPVAVSRFRLLRALPARLLVHVRSRPGADGELRCDLDLRAPDGALLAQVEGLGLRAPAQADDRYTLGWSSLEPASSSIPAGSWWLLGQGALADALADRLAEALPGLRRAGSPPEDPGPGPQHVVDLRPLAARDIDGAGRALTEALRLARRVDAGSLSWVVSGPDGLFQAPLWGFHRTLRLERPELRTRVIELEGASPEALIGALLRADDEDELRVDAGGLRGRRLLRSRAGAPIALTGDALITGGGGGLGSRFAEALARGGARRITLLGRQRPADELRAGLGRYGAEILALRADVSDAASLRAALADLPAPPRVIVHAAGVLEDASVHTLDAARLERVLAPKLRGAWNLHELGLDLDAFILCSSAAGVLGSPGQAAYAAANTFLDALAAHRRASGLPAVSIAWGPWAEVGMAARAGRLEAMASDGMGAIAPEVGAAMLPELASSLDPLVAVLPLDLERLAASRYGRLPLLHSLLDTGVSTPEAEALPVLEMVTQMVAATFHMEADQVRRVRTLRDLGLDSITTGELRGRIRRQLGLDIPLAELLLGPSLAELVARIEAALAQDQVQSLADDEVERMLRALLTEGASPLEDA